MAADFGHESGNGLKQGVVIGALVEALAQLLEDVAEGAFGIGVADGSVILADGRVEALQVAVVGEHPVMPPHFAHEGVGVGQGGAAAGGFADVGDDVFRFDLIGLDQVGHRGLRAGFVVVEQAYAFLFEKADAEAVYVVVGQSAAPAEAFKGKDNVGGCVAVHAKKLAHGGIL